MTGIKKTHWLRNTLIVLVACAVAGTALAAILFRSGENRTYVSTSILFSFDGAAEGKAPNGYPFDMNGILQDSVLDEALEASGLSGVYTAEQLRENMNVTGEYPPKMAELMTVYVSLLDTNADFQTALQDYHATQYTVLLYNDFDRSISRAKLNELLGNIVTAFRAHFAKTYSLGLAETEPIENLPEYDYAQQLEAISGSVSQQSRYAAEMAAKAPDFMVDQMGFGDIVVRYENLGSDINRLNATVMLNAVSKDPERLQKRYEMEIRTQKIQLDSLTEELKRIEEQVNAYEKDGIIYLSSNGELSVVGSETTGTYDKLVAKRKEVTEKIANINARIAMYQERLDDMTGAAPEEPAGEEEGTTTAAAQEPDEIDMEALKAQVEGQIEALVSKKNAISADFTALLAAYFAQEINEKTISVTAVKYYSPSLLSAAFALKVIKTAGPICAVGFVTCLVLLIRSRRKEEKVRKG